MVSAVPQTVIGDGIIIWRVFAFWSTGRERFVLFIPLAFLAGSFSTRIVSTYLTFVLTLTQQPLLC